MARHVTGGLGTGTHVLDVESSRILAHVSVDCAITSYGLGVDVPELPKISVRAFQPCRRRQNADLAQHGSEGY